MRSNRFFNFMGDEDGAVTVDWVVLTAVLIGLALASLGIISSGMFDLSGDLGDNLSEIEIITN